jgi:hypothetical protein
LTYGADSIYHSRDEEAHGDPEESEVRFTSEFQRVKRVLTGFDPRL